MNLPSSGSWRAAAGKIPGFNWIHKPLLDQTNFKLEIYPVKGINNDGDELNGYIYEMQTHGSQGLVKGRYLNPLMKNINNILKDNGIEIPMGYHAIINLFIGLFITTKTSVIHTPALFTASRFEETGLTGPWIIYEVILYALAYAIFSRKYKWNNDWIKDIRSRVSR